MLGWKCGDENVGMKMREWKSWEWKIWGWKWGNEKAGDENARNESAGMKVWGWKCGDENAGMKMRGWKCGNENVGMKKWEWKCWGWKIWGWKSQGMKNRGWKWKDEKSGDEVSLSHYYNECIIGLLKLSCLLQFCSQVFTAKMSRVRHLILKGGGANNFCQKRQSCKSKSRATRCSFQNSHRKKCIHIVKLVRYFLWVSSGEGNVSRGI